MKITIIIMMNMMRMRLVRGMRVRRVIGKLSIMGIMLMMNLSLREIRPRMSISRVLISHSNRLIS